MPSAFFKQVLGEIICIPKSLSEAGPQWCVRLGFNFIRSAARSFFWVCLLRGQQSLFISGGLLWTYEFGHPESPVAGLGWISTFLQPLPESRIVGFQDV